MSGLVMYPKIMKEKTRTMQKQLEQLEPYAEAAHNVLGAVEENHYFLSGVAWDSVRTYMSEVQQPLMEMYQLWIKQQKAATMIYHMAACALPNVHCLDEVRLEEEKERYEILLDREYDREHPKYSRIRRYRRMIREINAKLTAMRIFVSTTRGIYDRPAELLAILEKADTMLKGVGMDPATYTINYTSVDKEWLLKIQENVSYEYLKKLGISDETIKRMEELGLSGVDLRATYESLQTEEDKGFFLGILNEDYRKTFQIDPDKLSIEAKSLLVRYTRLLMNKGKIDELQILINEMLYTDENHSFYGLDDKAGHSKAYVNILFEMSSLILEEEGMLILDSKEKLKEDEVYRLCQNVEELSYLNVLWGSIRSTAFNREYFEAVGIEIPEYLEYKVYGNQIEKLEKTLDGFNFNMIYSTGVVKDRTLDPVGDNILAIEWHKDNPLTVVTKINTIANEIEDQKGDEIIQSLKKQKEELAKKYLINSGLGIMGAFCPEAELVVEIMKGIKEGSAEKIGDKSYGLLEESGIIKPEIMERYNSGGKSALAAGTNIIDCLNEGYRIDAQIADEYANAKIGWFGVTSSFDAGGMTETVNEGFYNAYAMKDLKDWEEKGLISVIAKEIEKGDREKFIENLKYQLNKDGNYNEAVKTLMEGGDIWGMDDKKFDDAEEAIQSAFSSFYTNVTYEDLPFKDGFNIQTTFQRRTKEAMEMQAK